MGFCFLSIRFIAIKFSWFRLKQRREQAIDRLHDPSWEGEGAAVVQCDLLADLHGLQKVVPDGQHRRVPAEPDAVLELKVKAAVIQVAAAHGRIEVIRHHRLGVDKAGGELEDSGSRLQQHRVVGLGHGEDAFFVRDVRRHDAHVHPRPGGDAEGGGDGLVDGQIGRSDIEVPLGLRDHLQVQVRPYGVVGVGRVGIGDNDTSGGLQRRQLPGPEQAEVGAGVLVVPHGQEEDGQAPSGLPPQAQGVVLPVAKALFSVHVFVGQVQTADVAGHAVDDGDLPVVPVVLVDGQDGHQGLENAAQDPAGM